jgi:hypothetical protein
MGTYHGIDAGDEVNGFAVKELDVVLLSARPSRQEKHYQPGLDLT